jgi:LysR family transcriptional activator of nhaA
MEWLNYHHLLYFWTVAREGGLGPASEKLRLAKPTLSGQIHALEDSLGEKLFTKVGKKLVLTDVGQVVFRYAEEIFGMGREMVDVVKGRAAPQHEKLHVGLVEALPKLIVRRLLEPALQAPEPVRLVCFEDDYENLLARLANQELDLVIADAPIPRESRVRAYNHLLGECGVSFFGAPRFASMKAKFPQSLHGAPLLLPMSGIPIRRDLEQWFDAVGVRPRIVAECDDSALIKAFGADGLGIFTAPSVVEKQIVDQYRTPVIGRIDAVRERFYAISPERRLKHPAAVLISETARLEMFRE